MSAPRPTAAPASRINPKLVFLGALAIAFLTWLLMGRPGLPGNQQAQAGGPMAVPVTLAAVEEAPVSSSSEFLAQVSSDHATTIMPQVDGKITRVLVDDGSQVRAGQPLFQLDARREAGTVTSLSAAASATAKEQGVIQATTQGLVQERAAVMTDLAFNQKQLARMQELATTDSVAAQDVDRYQATVQQLKDRVASLSANIRSQQVRLEQLRSAERQAIATRNSAAANLDYYTIRAPYGGQIGEVTARVGDTVSTSTLLTTLTATDRTEVAVAIPADYLSHLTPGTLITLRNGLDEEVAQAHIFFVSPQVDPAAQTVLVKAKVNNARGSLRVDQKLRARLVWGERRELTAPVTAVTRMGGQTFLYVAEATPKKGIYKAHLRPVTLGEIHGERVVVTSGLKPGQTLVTAGTMKLQEGVSVMDLQEATH
jgi:multidrug efflux pump subunit AcrA (membrane-fusion protein)